MIRINTNDGCVIEVDGRYRHTSLSLDDLFTSDDPARAALTEAATAPEAPAPAAASLRAPIESQEMWAAGVTYLRSRTARMEEAKDAGGGDFYDRVYAAARPEIFLRRRRTALPAPEVRCGSAAIRNGTCPSPSSRSRSTRPAESSGSRSATT